LFGITRIFVELNGSASGVSSVVKRCGYRGRYKKRAASARSPVTILGNAPRGFIDMAPEVGLRPALAAPAGENVDVVGDEAEAVLGSESLSMQSELHAGKTPV
jgi:hypothetical protein